MVQTNGVVLRFAGNHTPSMLSPTLHSTKTLPFLSRLSITTDDNGCALRSRIVVGEIDDE